MPSAAGLTRRDENKAIRKEDWRERIRGSGILTKVFDNIDKMQELAELSEIPDTEEDNSKAIPPSTQIHNLQMANNQNFRLLDKVLPDLKAIEVDVSGTIGHVELDYEGFVAEQ